MELISGIEAELVSRSRALALQVVPDHPAEIAVYERWSAEHRVDGVFIVDVRVDDDRLQAVQDLQLPAVVIAGPGDLGGLPAVWSDDAAAITEAVEYLCALGHCRIARVSGPPELLHTRIRTRAFAAAGDRLGVEFALTVPADYSGEDGARATRWLLSSTPRPTAILYDNDIMAVAGLAVAHEMGVSVPDDLSIIAWDDSLLCRVVHPTLTTLSRDVSAYGTAAARCLLRLVEDGSTHDVQHATANLVPRGSTARYLGRSGVNRLTEPIIRQPRPNSGSRFAVSGY
jgi:DNA-binding LacI/PurR family transcriptional regulator